MSLLFRCFSYNLFFSSDGRRVVGGVRGKGMPPDGRTGVGPSGATATGTGTATTTGITTTTETGTATTTGTVTTSVTGTTTTSATGTVTTTETGTATATGTTTTSTTGTVTGCGRRGRDHRGTGVRVWGPTGRLWLPSYKDKDGGVGVVVHW